MRRRRGDEEGGGWEVKSAMCLCMFYARLRYGATSIMSLCAYACAMRCPTVPTFMVLRPKTKRNRTQAQYSLHEIFLFVFKFVSLFQQGGS